MKQHTGKKSRIRELEKRIKANDDNIKLLYAFALGEKKLKRKINPNKVQGGLISVEDDKRLLWAISNLRDQTNRFQAEITTLKGGSL